MIEARQRKRPSGRPAAPALRYNGRVAGRFTLLDGAYYEALRVAVAALGDRGLPFCLVGGGASQAWIASLRTGEGKRRLSDEPVLRTALRPTQDLDFSTRADPADMLSVLNTLAAERGSGSHVLGPRSLRLGPVSVSFTLGPEDLSGMEAAYDAFLDSRTSLRIRRGRDVLEVPAIALEELLATKLTRRGDKAKDILDVTQLLAAVRVAERTVDLGAVRDLVRQHPDALALLDEFARRLAEEGA